MAGRLCWIGRRYRNWRNSTVAPKSLSVYSRLMRLAPTFIAALFFVALLSMQLSGLHMHVNPQGDSGELHGSHTHGHDPDPIGHDHSLDIDVPVLELGATWAKILTFLIPIVALLLSVVWVLQSIWSPPRIPQFLQRRSHWRPPLRAPPPSA